MDRDGADGFLLTSTGKSAGVVWQLRNALGTPPPGTGRRVWTGSSDAFPAAAAFADGHLHLRPAAGPGFIDDLLGQCGAARIGVVVPLADHDLDRMAPVRERFAAARIRLVCSPAEVVELCSDKLSFAAWAAMAGLPHPPTRPAATGSEGLTFPLFAKPRRGAGSAGAGVCRDARSLEERCTGGTGWIAQPVLRGPEFTVDAYVAQGGRITVCVPRRRDAVVGGQSFVSHTVRDPEVGDLAMRTLGLLAARGLHGPANVQIIRNPDPVLLEVNPRLGSASVLSNQATGGRLLANLVAEAVGGEATGDPSDFEAGLSMTRFVGEVYHRGGGRDAIHQPR